MSKIRKFITNLHNSLLPAFLKGDKRKTILFYVSVYILVASTFLTLFGQIPLFASRNLTQLFQVGWVIVLIPLLMLDYKRFLNSFFTIVFLLLPFIIYCLISLAIGIQSIKYGGTTLILLSAFIFLVGSTFGKYKTKNNINAILFAYLFGALVYALIVFFTRLKGYDISNQIYAFGSKNSAGPIFMGGAIIAFYLFQKKNLLSILVRWGIIFFFVTIIVLSKNRAILVLLPLLILPMLFMDNKKPFIPVLITILLISGIFVLFLVPKFYETIVINILFNGKRNIDDIFSVRLTQIVINLQNIKPILGNGQCYFDCMPISLLCTYGVLGLITLLPFAVFPFIVLFKFRKLESDKRYVYMLFLLAIMYLLGSLFEGYGYFGPGAKTFILWFAVGSNFINVERSGKKSLVTHLNTWSLHLSSKINKSKLTFFIQFLLFAICFVGVFSSAISSSIGSVVVDRLPANNIFAKYTEVKDIQISTPVDNMCVGQRITYNATYNPTNAYDATVCWNTGWIDNPIIDVNGYSGEVTAKKTGKALLHMHRYRVGHNGVYIQYNILDYLDYNFDKLYISSKPFSKSFDYNMDNIMIIKGSTTHVYYDNYYLPKIDDFEFVSSDTNIAVVDPKTGIITAINEGTCQISGIIHNTYNNKSVNSITINVSNGVFNPVSSLSVNHTRPCYQYEPYEIIPIFNDGATDKNVNIKIMNLNYDLDGKIITFKECGTAHITVVSQNDSSIFYEFDLNVKKNKPTNFLCKTNRMRIGEIKNAKELGLFLVFENGYQKIVTEEDLLFDPLDFTNRAWSDRNGLISNRTTVMAVRKGIMSFKFTSKIDNNVTNTFKIISSIYTAREYSYLSSGIGLIAFSVVAIIAILFSLFLNIRKRWVIYSSISLFSIIFILIAALKYGFTLFVIISLAALSIILIAVILMHILLKNKLPLPLLEDPINYMPRNEQLKNYKITI